MSDRNASASAFGWDFQTNSAILLKITLSLPPELIVSNPCAVIPKGSLIAIPVLAAP